MGYKPLQQGTSRREFVAPGVVGSGRWGGMRRERPRTSIPDNQFWTLQNVRMISNEILVRGGQSKANSVALSGTEVTGIYQDHGADVESPVIFYMREA